MCTLLCMLFRFPLKTIREKHKGVLGDNVLSKMLPHLDRNRMWLLPFCHAVFFGLLKTLCEVVFPLAGSKAPTEYVRQPGLPNAMMAMPPSKRLSKEARARVLEHCANMVSQCVEAQSWVQLGVSILKHAVLDGIQTSSARFLLYQSQS